MWFNSILLQESAAAEEQAYTPSAQMSFSSNAIWTKLSRNFNPKIL